MKRRVLITAPALVLVVAGTLWAQGVSGPVGLRTTTVLQTTTTAHGQPLQFPLFRNQFTGVDGINNGSVPMRAWVVFAGEEGTPPTVRP